MRSTHLLLTLSFAAVPTLFACGDKGDDTGSGDNWMPHCESSETELAWDEASALGFSGADVAATLGAAPAAPLSWSAGGTTMLDLAVAWSDKVVYVDQWEAEPPDDVTEIPDIAVICNDYLAIDATLSFTTADGLLDETFPVTLSAEEESKATFFVEGAAADFAHPEIFDPYLDASADESHVSLMGSLLEAGATEGELDYVTSGTDGETAWQATERVAAWGPETG